MTTEQKVLTAVRFKPIFVSILLSFASSLASAASPFEDSVQMPLEKLRASPEGTLVEAPSSKPINEAGTHEQSSFTPTLDGPFEFTAEEKELLLFDLESLYAIKCSVASRLHNERFGGKDGNAYEAFFKERIKHLRRSSSDSVSQYAQTVPVPQEYYHDTIYIGKLYFDVPGIMRLAILLHESRHSEIANDYWHHITCPQPYLDENGQAMTNSGRLLAGTPNLCEPDSRGAFGTSILFLNNVSRNCTNCSPEMKMAASELSQRLLKYIVDPDERNVLRE